MNEAYFVLSFFAISCVTGIVLFAIADKNDKNDKS